MATRDPLDVLQVPGRLVLAPTDLSASYPYGGSEIGYVDDAAIVVNQRYETIKTDEYGEEVVDVKRIRSTATLGFIMRQWDEDLYDLVFQIEDNDGTIRGGSYNSAGALLAATGVKLLFVPDDPEMPGFITYRAVPCLDQTATLNFQLDAELNVAMIFYLLRSSATSEAYQVGLLRNLDITPD